MKKRKSEPKYPSTSDSLKKKQKINLRREFKSMKKSRGKTFKEPDYMGDEEEVFTPGQRRVKKKSLTLGDLFG